MPQLIDLLHPLERGQLNFPFDPQIVLVHNTVASIGYNLTQISMSTHHVTHLDVPYHFLDDGNGIALNGYTHLENYLNTLTGEVTVPEPLAAAMLISGFVAFKLRRQLKPWLLR